VDFLPLDFGLQRPPVDSTKTTVPGSGGRHQPMPTTADQPVATFAHYSFFNEMVEMQCNIPE
jgi:hypothetical protein